MKIFDPKLTGSIEIQSPVIGGITSSLFGTASWATNVVNAGGLSGGQNKYITRWSSATTVTTSSMYEGDNKNIAINTTVFDVTNPQALLVSGSTINIISGEARVNSYAQLNIINKEAGANSSADIVATNDAASETGNFIDLGINSSNYGGAIGSNNEAYLYNTGSNLLIGNTTRGADANVKFFAGNDAIVFPLIVTGSNIIATGSLLGTSSWAENSITASFVKDLNQNLTITGSVILSSSAPVELFILGDQQITGSLSVTSGIRALSLTGSLSGSLTGSLFGTSSNSFTASYVSGSVFTSVNPALSASYALSSSYALTASFSVTASRSITSSFSITSSNAITSSLALTASFYRTFPFTGSAVITGSLGITGSTSISGTFRLNMTEDPGSAITNAVFLFASRSEDGIDTDWYYRHSGNLWNFDWYENIVDTGLIYGGIVSITSSVLDTAPNTTQIRVTSGLGLYVQHNATTSSKGETVASLVPFGPFTQSYKDFITSSQAGYLYVDTSGNLQVQSSIFTTDQYHQAFPLGVFFSLTTSSIASFGDLRVTNYGQQQQAGEFIRAFGPLKINGYDMTAQSGSLRFSIAAGKSFRFGGFYTQDPDSPSVYDSSAVPTASLVRVYQDPTVLGGFRATTNAGVPFSTVDPTKWDDGSGTLQTVGSGEFTIQRVFEGVVNNVSYIYYGQNKYTSLAAAIQSTTTENFNESQTSIITLPFIGYIITEGTATNLLDTGSARIINAGLFRNTAGSSGGGGAAVTALDDLSDVTLTAPVDGQALVYQSGVWVNSNPTSASYASSASFAVSAAYAPGGAGLSGGQDKYITRWSSATTVTTSSMYEGDNKNIAINVTSFNVTNPEALRVSGSTINVISGEANINTYTQLNIVNKRTGAQASADIVATNDTGNETGNYVDLGINSSNYGGALGSPNEAYLFNTGSNFIIGNITRGANANLKLFAGNDGTVFPVIVTGSNVILTGSLTGSFKGEISDLTQHLKITGSLTITGSNGSAEFLVVGQTIISGALVIESPIATETDLKVVGGAVITGSLIVSGSGGYGIFSKGITLADFTSPFNVTGSYFVWRAPYPATVVALWAIKSGSSQVSINARRSGSGQAFHTASNLVITANNLWSSANAVTNSLYSAGDSLEVILSGSSVIQTSIQVDFIKR